MGKLKETWKKLTKFEKCMIMIRDASCFCMILFALLNVFGVIRNNVVSSVMMPVIALAQSALSWKRSRATSLFLLGFLIFFFVLLFISKK
jgi:hypothetical protein